MATMKQTTPKIPAQLVTVACLSGALTIVFNLTSILLSTLALVYRYDCSAGDLKNGAELFIITAVRMYILDDECNNYKQIEGITKSDSIFILVIITLTFAVVNLLSACALISVVRREDAVQNLDIFAYVYIGVCVSSLVVDLTLGVHLGMDYQMMHDKLSLSLAALENYPMDIARLVSFLLMSIALKGYIGHAMNITLLVILADYVLKYQRVLYENEHSIHKLGVLTAFDQPKRLDDPWQPHRNEMFLGSPRGPQLNHAFLNDEEPQHGPIRENPLSDISNRSYDRSDSWLHTPANVNAGPPGLGSRPFSYLEEPKRPIPVKAPTPPASDPNWRRDPWPPAPPVPDPDYSPPPRRLKSALKAYP